jgi:hypothetical protein
MYIGSYLFKVCIALLENGGIKGFRSGEVYQRDYFEGAVLPKR